MGPSERPCVESFANDDNYPAPARGNSGGNGRGSYHNAGEGCQNTGNHIGSRPTARAYTRSLFSST